jgi:hypothetical protein
VSDIETRVTGLTSRGSQPADITLTTSLNRQSPLTVTGRINPLNQDLFLDLGVGLSGLDLVPVSAYSGKWAGYAIKKGKLTLDLHYRVDQRILDSTNTVFLDQFDFGEKIDSKEAIDAPVTLAVALLKDTRNRITLNLPVKGSLDDPEFSVAGVVVTMIMNLLAKAATAPFALLGSMFQGGESLDLLAFGPASAELLPETRDKVAVLVKALNERPGIRLDLTGHSDPVADGPALTERLFLRMVKAEKLKLLSGKGLEGRPVDQVELSPGEYETFLKAAFAAHQGSVPGTGAPPPGPDAAGGSAPPSVTGALPAAAASTGAGTLSLDQMKETLKNAITITGDDLDQLARDRAQAVLDLLVKENGIDPGRLFLVGSAKTPPESKSGPGPAVTLGMK